MNINNVPAIVTGGASGLGEATARLLAEHGAKVAIFDVQEDKAKQVAKEINGIAISCDVTNAESAIQAFAAAKKAHGACGIAVNCAGIGTPAKILGEKVRWISTFLTRSLTSIYAVASISCDSPQTTCKIEIQTTTVSEALLSQQPQ